LRSLPDKPGWDGVGTGDDGSDVRWISDVQSRWPETGLGIQPARRKSARDERLHRRLGELGISYSDLSEMVLQMRYVITHEIVERGGLILRYWFPRKLVEMMSCPAT